jgi:hypothetical protein
MSTRRACRAFSGPTSSRLADLTRLDELDLLEWWDVARRVNPRITWAEFLHQWHEFQRLKAARKAN